MDIEYSSRRDGAIIYYYLQHIVIFAIIRVLFVGENISAIATDNPDKDVEIIQSPTNLHRCTYILH